MTKRLADMTPEQRRTRVAELIGNPRTRASIPTSFLPEKFRRQRQQAIFAKQPIVPGSLTTNADLARQRQAATDLQFGQDPLAKSRQAEQDTGHYYDDYRKALQESQARQATIGQAGVNQITSIAGAFAPQDATGQSTQNQTDVANGAAVRQAMLANLGGVASGQATAHDTYANTLANVVAPGQKLAALAAARQSTNDLRGQIGAYGTKYDADARTAALAQADADVKNNIALKTLGLNEKQTDADIDLRRGVDPITGKPLAADPVTGYGPGGPGQNKYGYTYDEWSALPSSKQDSIRAGKGDKPKKTKPNNGKGWASNDKQGDAQDTIAKGINYIKTLLRQNGALDRHQAAQYLLTDSPGQTVYENVPIKDKNGKDTGKTKRQPVLNADGTTKRTGSWNPIQSLFASVALDMSYDGHVSAHNVRRLHALGYRIDSLGYPTKAPPTGSPIGRPAGGT